VLRVPCPPEAAFQNPKLKVLLVTPSPYPSIPSGHLFHQILAGELNAK
jgi:hypothetical protein